MGNKTALQIIQKEIDKCNKGDGCKCYCGKEKQQNCPKLKAHADRIAWCRKMEINVIYW